MTKEERVLGDPVLTPAALECASVHPSGTWVLSTSRQPWLPLSVGALHLGRTHSLSQRVPRMLEMPLSSCERPRLREQ